MISSTVSPEGFAEDACLGGLTILDFSRLWWPVSSALPLANHSCSPNTAFQISSSIPEHEWAFVALANIDVGEEFGFFYPSTEWDMDQPFDCHCGAKVGRLKELVAKVDLGKLIIAAPADVLKDHPGGQVPFSGAVEGERLCNSSYPGAGEITGCLFDELVRC